MISIHPECGLANSSLLVLNLIGNYNLDKEGRRLLEQANEDRKWEWEKERILWLGSRCAGSVWYRLKKEEIENVMERCRKSFKAALAAPPKLRDDP